MFVEARVADASDRLYEPAAIWLIDHAQRSVVLSLYLIRDSDDARHPVNRLLNDLWEATQRGVSVTLYLNTKFKGAAPGDVLHTPGLTRLTHAGAHVIAHPSTRRFHDKLLIVDERYILEGSTNWSVEALKSNGESNTVIDSPALAKIKLIRLRPPAPSPGALGREPVAPPVTAIPFPAALLTREGALTRLVARQQDRAFKTFLLLLRDAAAQGGSECFVNLEALGEDLGLPASWDETAVRRQVMKVLKVLAEPEPLVEVRFTYGRDAWVKLLLPTGPMTDLPAALLEDRAFHEEPALVTYLRLVRVHLASEGVSFDTLTIRDLSDLTGLHPHRLQRARRQLLLAP